MTERLSHLAPRLLLLALIALPWLARADAFDEELLTIQQRWAEIQYQLAEDDRADAFEALRERTRAFAERHPRRAGQCSKVEYQFRVFRRRFIQRIGQNQAAFRIGVSDLHRDTGAARQHIERPERVARDTVFDRRH